MNINFDAQILSLKGEPIYGDVQQVDIVSIVNAIQNEDLTDKEKVKACRAVLSGGKGDHLTLGSVAATVLIAQDPKEDGIKPEEKVKRFQLAMLAVAGGVQDLSVELVADLKKLIGKLYGPLVVGRAYELIEDRRSGPRLVADTEAE